MAKNTQSVIAKLQQEALGGAESVPDGPLTLPNLAAAYSMFDELLEQPHANAAKIGKKANINPVSIGDLKNRKLSKITVEMFEKLKKLHDAVQAGAVVFEETRRGRKAGSTVSSKNISSGKTKPVRKTTSPKLPAIFGSTPLVTKEMISEKERQLKGLALEIEYLKEMKKLQEKFIGRA
ncbi:MAG: hypothetical protein HY962_06105 [Ignavibacteriae bacterium]|nr:hypothetical protein [Ignavibacteriota bacterium]